jgi:hypothetical protein
LQLAQRRPEWLYAYIGVCQLPMTEERGKFLLSLVRYARPIPERAGDIPS